MAFKEFNYGEQVMASAARTATSQSDEQTNRNARGCHVIVDVTAVTATPSVVFTIQGKCPVSNKWYDILVSAAITATGTTVLKVYPGIVAAANAAASDILPATWRVKHTHGDADSITFSVGVNYVR